MNLNKQIESLRKDVLETINNHNQLPISIVYYILKDCLNDVEKVYRQVLEQEEKNIDEEEKIEE